MLFDSLIFLMIGASIFGLGVGLGAIIEFRRSKECFSEILIERDETYIQNTEAFLESANRIEGKIRILHQRISYTTEELRQLNHFVTTNIPEETQIIPIPTKIEDENHTPPMPYKVDSWWR
tara:strand:+ start:255 stop:617 length:363 start_codon:yes stop_codon:yes gene_type:complete